MNDESIGDKVKDFYAGLSMPDQQAQNLLDLQGTIRSRSQWRYLALATCLLAMIAAGSHFYFPRAGAPHPNDAIGRASDPTRSDPIATPRQGVITVVGLYLHGDGCPTCREVSPTMQELQQEFAGDPVLFTTLNLDQTDQLIAQQHLLEQLLDVKQNTFYQSIHPSMVLLEGDPMEPKISLLKREEAVTRLRSMVSATP